MEIENKRNKIKSSFTIPDSAVYFTFFAVNISEIDNNYGQGYDFHVFENNKPIRYSYLMKGYNNKFNEFLFKGKVDYNEAAKNIEKEWQLYPEMENKCVPYYLEVLLKIPEKKNETLVKIKEKLDNGIQSKIQEREIRYFANLYYENNLKSLDSVKNILTKLFQNGITSSEKRISEIKYGENSNTIFEDIDYLLNSNHELTTFQRIDLVNYKLAVLLYQNRIEIFESVFSKAQKEYPKILLYSFLAHNFNEYAYSYFKGNKLDLANLFSKQSLRFYSNLDTLSISYGNSLDTYASIIYASGDLNNATKYQSKAVELMNLQNDTSNQRLIEYLNEARNFPEIINVGRKIIKANTSTNLIDSLYKNALKKLNKEDPDYLKLKKDAFQKKQKEILSKIINQKAQDFALFDLNGKTVQLKDYKGKILIIDFWATWCKPCLASFPAMKKLQNEFKDKNVKFVFISTLEHVNTSDSINLTEKILELANIRHFNEFEILIDQKNSKSGDFKMALDYNVQGIPAKFIVDKNGNLRYKSVGFGSEDKLRFEIDTVVNFLLSE
ncbi:TlpA disulfide reductase family protein [Lacihabitans sp. LS3-19]|uniref:TlpA family protein disulfide reductase n=1 Tax=Lacihabitans sp. LS3-19 TaxID=2487335 RepID=UPI0020CDA5CE|nr:TlpA disulfide reductase family protein [Lacihabitans sp. LS3-19]